MVSIMCSKLRYLRCSMTSLILPLMLLLRTLPNVGAHVETTGLTFELPDNDQVCFYEDFEGSIKYVFEFYVVAGGNKDVDVLVESPNGKTLFEDSRASSGLFEFVISWGTFKFCFDNRFSAVAHKTIYFVLRPADRVPLAVEGGRRLPSANTHAEALLESVHSLNTVVMQYQTAYRLDEARNRYAAETLNARIQVWSIMQTVVILVAGFGQLLLLKSFFTERRQSSLSLLANGKTEVTFSVPPIRP